MNAAQDQDKVLFANLVMMLATSAWQCLGKVVDPSTGKTATNLEMAQVTIDILDMLHRRTESSLDPDEKRMLGDLLYQLRMNYVETRSAAPATTAEGTASAEPPADAQAPTTPPADDKSAKFHKSYG